jgi:hypothetical protein
MNIKFVTEENTSAVAAVCPYCKTSLCRKHGFYTRKGFHGRCAIVSPILIQRYRCLNKECSHCTFSVLPPMVMRYCRFFWPCLLAVWKATASAMTDHYLARIWNVGRHVILRAVALKDALWSWVEKLYRELTSGGPARSIELMVKIITAMIGPDELRSRWYCHRYPQRIIRTKYTDTQFIPFAST